MPPVAISYAVKFGAVAKRSWNNNIAHYAILLCIRIGVDLCEGVAWKEQTMG